MIIEPNEFDISPDQICLVRVGVKATAAELISQNILVQVEG